MTSTMCMAVLGYGGMRGSGTKRDPLRLVRRLLSWDSTRKSGGRAALRKIIKRYLLWSRGLLLDPQLRYAPAVAILQTDLRRPRQILDVGSGNASLAYFLHEPVVGVDIDFSAVERDFYAAKLLAIRASATKLPFRDGSFEAVVSMDTIEHIHAASRSAAIGEIFRVAHTLVILGFPYGEASGRLDRIAFAEEQSRGIQTKWREEHVRYGIPGPDVHAAVLAAARNHRPIMHVRWFEHESLFGVRLRSKLRQVIPRESRLYGALFFPLYAFHQTGIRTRGYRRIYVAR